MADVEYAPVTVTMQNSELTCSPDWVHLRPAGGATDIRWVFAGVPKEAVSVIIEFLPTVPAKYLPPPDAPGPLQPRGVHRGFGAMPPSAGSSLPDLVTADNTMDPGYFYYQVALLNATGDVIAQADPGGDNDPGPHP